MSERFSESTNRNIHLEPEKFTFSEDGLTVSFYGTMFTTSNNSVHWFIKLSKEKVYAAINPDSNPE